MATKAELKAKKAEKDAKKLADKTAKEEARVAKETAKVEAKAAKEKAKTDKKAGLPATPVEPVEPVVAGPRASEPVLKTNVQFEGATVVSILKDGRETETQFHCQMSDGTSKHVPKDLFV